MLKISSVTKQFEGKPLLRNINLHLDKGEIVCLLGASGSGKSTLLRIIAGLEQPDHGEICLDGVLVNDTPTHLRRFGLMFQDYALFNHLNVADNIGFGLKMQGLAETERTNRIAEVAKLAQVEPFLLRTIQDLSGGEQQRVALARSLAPQPVLMMLDEPLGALDRNLKETLLQDLRAILKKSELPTLYVTHDQDEAYAIADRIALLENGQIVQDDIPAKIHSMPANEWVARFMGLGNIVSGQVASTGVAIANGLLPVFSSLPIGSAVTCLVRPTAKIDAQHPMITGRVSAVQFGNDGYHIELDNGQKYIVPTECQPGEQVGLSELQAQILVGGG